MKDSIIFLMLSFLIYSCGIHDYQVKPGAYNLDEYLEELQGKRIGLVGNHTTMIGDIHLVDTLLARGVEIAKIFGPEHGFWGVGDAGAKILDEKHPVHEIEIISLYGRTRKPRDTDIEDLDVIIFDLQDVGVRFYTYISTLQYVMEACARHDVRLIVLDRPNPNGFYVDGPVLDTAYRSFVGLTPIPVVHGMTIGEYALMLNGEGWLEGGLKCRLQVIKCENYTHQTLYELPVRPSPNLPNMNSIYLYPGLCFFEGTVLSCGRGTDTPFQLFGHPDLPYRDFSFIPEPNEGASNPLFNGEKCYGVDLRNALDDEIVPVPRLQLGWLIKAYRDFPDKDKFFNSYMTLLAGSTELEQQIKSGMTEEEIRATWQDDLEAFKKIRQKYLLYD